MYIGGALALVGLAGLAYYMSATKVPASKIDETVLSQKDKELVTKVKALGTPQEDKEGNLTFDYLIKFCEIVGKHAKLI